MKRLALAALAAIALVVAGIDLVCGAHPVVAIAARAYPTYKPASPAAVVAAVPPRDAREVAMRRQLLAQPARVDLADRKSVV